ncbi:phenoloxidase-activating factor 1-like isoform X1 [Drosophila eugracilis]|uniref:phenoloxidase-activating factor 1-like isoform X1 n=1 Tax=Drosophila eugracilis TaxID=29029 RepID=UPI0007E5BD0B|nr:phenoloxidase-activating factor 1-like isoform X1 [Drosophila eugracilis]
MVVRLRVFFLLFCTLSLFCSSIHAQVECGKLRESQLYNRKEITEPNEYTWIGRAGYGDWNNNSAEFISLSVLIKPRYAIIPASYVIGENVTAPTFILFGDWRASDKFFLLGHCRSDKRIRQCTPPPQLVDIEDLVVHPGYISSELQYNLALAKLVRSVEFSDFVQPICLPPAEKEKGNHIAQTLEIAGFKKSFLKEKVWQEDEYYRQKFKVTTTSLQFCNSKMLVPVRLTENNLCAVRDKRKLLFHGSPLMGIEVVDEQPKNFYLIGILNAMITYPSSEIDSFVILRIYPFRNWILNNIED